MKSRRQAEILNIIETTDVETQDQLLEELQARGIVSTQATISRDIKELHLVKEQTEQGVYRYVASERKAEQDHGGRLRNIFKEGVTSFDVAQNIIVVKTMPGLANAAAAALDGMENAALVGSLAGDDTVLVIMRDNQAAEAFCGELHRMVK